MMNPRLPLLFSTLLLCGSTLLAPVVADDSTFLKVYYNAADTEGREEDPANCNELEIFPCTIVTNNLALYTDDSLATPEEGYVLDTVCIKRDASFYDCSFNVKTPTEEIGFKGPLNVADLKPDVFDLEDHEGTATLMYSQTEAGNTVGFFDIARVTADDGDGDSSAASFTSSKQSVIMAMIVLTFGSYFL